MIWYLVAQTNITTLTVHVGIGIPSLLIVKRNLYFSRKNYSIQMKKMVLALVLCSFTAYAQKTDKYIKEDNVKRIISALASDEMKGRSAMDYASIDKAALLIEKEFKAIGLKPLPGLKSFRQEFLLYDRIERTSLTAT